MGLFDKKNNNRTRMFSSVGVPLTLTNMVIIVVLTLVLVQAIGLVFNLASVTLGPVFIMIAIGMTAAISVAIFKKIADGDVLTSKDVYAILVSAVIALLLLFFMRDLVPEVFRAGIGQIQSVIGF
jgi:hypothetical protein